MNCPLANYVYKQEINVYAWKTDTAKKSVEVISKGADAGLFCI